MKKSGFALLIIAMVFAGSVLLPKPGFSGVDVSIGINVPLPVFVFPAPPPVVHIPGTYAYTVPDVDIEIVFFGGYWYRPHSGYWYRAKSYNGPWVYIVTERVPGILLKLPPGYRNMPPGHQRIPYGQIKKNWRKWEKEKYWDKHEYRNDGKKQKQYKEEKKERKKEGKGGRGND